MGSSPFGERHHRRAPHSGGPLRPVFDSFAGREKPDHKTAALCKQVRRVVTLALTGECADPVLQALIVNDVLPAPNAGRLLVQVLAPSAHDHHEIVEILQRLEKVEGLLRSRIAETSARKRVPELTFDVIPTGPRPGPSPVSGEEAGHD